GCRRRAQRRARDLLDERYCQVAARARRPHRLSRPGGVRSQHRAVADRRREAGAEAAAAGRLDAQGVGRGAGAAPVRVRRRETCGAGFKPAPRPVTARGTTMITVLTGLTDEADILAGTPGVTVLCGAAA